MLRIDGAAGSGGGTWTHVAAAVLVLKSDCEGDGLNCAEKEWAPTASPPVE
jgi:hypothetical protein